MWYLSRNSATRSDSGPVAGGDHLQHEERRDQAGVRVGEVAEVVVAADLAGEDRVDLAHAALDEGVADAVHVGRAAGLQDRVAHGPGGAQVVDHRLGPGPGQDVARQQRREEVARHELAGVVDEEAAVGVAVEGDAQVGLVLADLADDELAVLRQERVGLVVGEAAVGVQEVGDGVDVEALEDRGQIDARHPVGRVEDHPQAADRVRVDEAPGSAPRSGPAGPRRGCACPARRRAAGRRCAIRPTSADARVARTAARRRR